MERIDWQLSSALLLLITGICWGFLYDLFQSLNRRRRLLNLMDLLFWVVSLFIIGPLIFFANWLELRLYVWISIGCGFLVYRLIFFRLVTLARHYLSRLHL